MDESGRRISFNLLTKSVISLSTMIGASDSPLGPHPERDLATNLHYSSIPIATKTSPIVESDINGFNKSTTSL
jgi:hypothetical protein